MAEVTRMRPQTTVAKTGITERLTNVVANKLSQLSPQRSNLLIVRVESHALTANNAHAAMLRLQQRAEQSDPAMVGQTSAALQLVLKLH